MIVAQQFTAGITSGITTGSYDINSEFDIAIVILTKTIFVFATAEKGEARTTARLASSQSLGLEFCRLA